jgi:two-component system OmpR family response regulator
LRGALERDRFSVDWIASLPLARDASRSVLDKLVLLDRPLPDGEGLNLISRLRTVTPEYGRRPVFA